MLRSVQTFVAKTKALRVGDPTQVDMHVGAITMQEQFDKIAAYVALANDGDGTILAGGKRWTVRECSGSQRSSKLRRTHESRAKKSSDRSSSLRRELLGGICS